MLLSSVGAANAGSNGPGSDVWSCYATIYNGEYCFDSANSDNTHIYYHHFKAVSAHYYGSGNLPLRAASDCADRGCNYSGTLFSSSTGHNNNTYNVVLACYNWSTCNQNAPYLGDGYAENEHTSSHSLTGYGYFY